MLGKRKRSRFIYRRFNKDFLFVCSADCSHCSSAAIAESIKLVNCDCCDGWSHHEHIDSLVSLTQQQVRQTVYICPLCENDRCGEFHDSRKRRIIEVSVTRKASEPGDIDSKNDTISNWDGFEADDVAQSIERQRNRDIARVTSSAVTTKRKRRRTSAEDVSQPEKEKDTEMNQNGKTGRKQRRSSRARRNSSLEADRNLPPPEPQLPEKNKKKKRKKSSKTSKKKQTQPEVEPQSKPTAEAKKKKKKTKSNNPSGQRKTSRGVWIDDRQKRSARARYKIATWMQQFEDLSSECNVRIDFECVNFDSLASNQWKPYRFQTSDRVKLRSIEARRLVIQDQREKIYVSMKKHRKLFVNPDEGERLQRLMNQLDGYREIIRRSLLDAYRAADKFEDETEAEKHREEQRKKWKESFPTECMEDVLLLDEEPEVEPRVETEKADALVQELIGGACDGDDDGGESE